MSETMLLSAYKDHTLTNTVLLLLTTPITTPTSYSNHFMSTCALSIVQPTYSFALWIYRLWPECGEMDSQEKYTSID
jgi:hypothetical protein